MTGCFITLEGGEGSGKSTLQAGLAARLIEYGIDTITTREPGGTPLAESVRNLVLHPPAGQSWSPLAEALLMNTARADHLDQLIRPALSANKFVVCDRFIDSTVAYQSVGARVATRTLQALQDIVVETSLPDLTLVLDISWEAARVRISERNGTSDAFEDRDQTFHHQVRDNFLTIAKQKPERCVVLDASQSAELLLDEAWKLVQARCIKGASK